MGNDNNSALGKRPDLIRNKPADLVSVLAKPEELTKRSRLLTIGYVLLDQRDDLRPLYEHRLAGYERGMNYEVLNGLKQRN